MDSKRAVLPKDQSTQEQLSPTACILSLSPSPSVLNSAVMALVEDCVPCWDFRGGKRAALSLAGREEGSKPVSWQTEGVCSSASTLPGFPLQEVWHLPIGATDTKAGAGDF